MQQLDIPLSAWIAADGTSAEADAGGGLAFNDGVLAGPHLLRLAKPALKGAMVHLAIRARPLPGCSTQLTVVHPLLGMVCRVSAEGVATQALLASALQTGRGDDGAITLSVRYFSSIDSAAIGTASPGHFYRGTGRPQWVFEEIALSVAAPETDAAHRIVALDIGNAGPLAPTWRALMPDLLPLAIPPADGPCEALEQSLALFPEGRLIKAVLYNKKGRRKLNRAADPSRSSLLATDRRTLRKFVDAAPFEVQEQVNVDCVRYDDLHAAGTAPAPELIRLNAQGAEHEVLQGFGNLLAGCLGLEASTALYPVYKGQKPLGELITLLDRFDLSLVGLNPRRERGQLVEAQAWFLKTPEWAEAQPKPVQARLAALRRATGFAA